ncbi:MAG TPA: FtsL-like putative cell division protein [Bacteroidia bacterium]|nr:FtsL-like putative cell division protein [Bacteroidia bacterium]
MANKFRDIPTQTDVLGQEQNLVEELVSGKIQKNKKPGRKGVLAKGLSSVFSGTFLSQERNLRHIPFLLFLAGIAIFYISNGYYADDKIREVNKLSNQLKELRTEYIYTKSELMFASKQSEVAKAAETLGLKEPVVPPVIIETDSSELYSSVKD